MKIYRIKISSWTSSFRYPNVISGYQPTLLVPPISTVLGIMNSCSGTYLIHDQLKLGYYFDYEAKAVDLETIYQVENNTQGIPMNQTKSNVIRREFLFNTRLYIYLFDGQYVDLFRNPTYQLLLGRSNDIATIETIEELELEEINNATKIVGQLVPLANNYLPGGIQALPLYFTNTIPRNNIGTQAFSVIPHDASDFSTQLNAYRDTIGEKEIDIYIHELYLGNE